MKRGARGDTAGGGGREAEPEPAPGPAASFPAPGAAMPCRVRRPLGPHGAATCGRLRPPRVRGSRRRAASRAGWPRDPASRSISPPARRSPSSPPPRTRAARYRNSPAGTGSRSPSPPQRAPLSPIDGAVARGPTVGGGASRSCRRCFPRRFPRGSGPAALRPPRRAPPACQQHALALLLPRPLPPPRRARASASSPLRTPARANG